MFHWFPYINLTKKNFTFSWLIFHVWSLTSPALMLDAEISLTRFGFGFIFLYLRIWIGWAILPYWVYRWFEWSDREKIELQPMPEEIEWDGDEFDD